MNKKEKCFICKKYNLIAEEHYIVPLAEVKRSNRSTYEDETIFLCPNCHTYLHLLLKGKGLDKVFEYFYSTAMKKSISKIFSRYFYIKEKNKR